MATSVWSVLVGASSLSLIQTSVGQQAGEIVSLLLMGLGITLLIVSILCFKGARPAFYAGMALSIAIAVLALTSGGFSVNLYRLEGSLAAVLGISAFFFD